MGILSNLRSKAKEKIADSTKNLREQTKSIKNRFDIMADKLAKFFKSKGYTDKYNLWDAIHNNEIGKLKGKKDRDRKAIQWVKEFSKNKSAQIKGKMLEPSMLYMFNYDTPKYEDTLDFFDTQPLVLVMGVVKTKNGLREIGINMHLLPEQIRKLVLFKVYNVYKINYNNALRNGQDTNFRISWKQILGITKDLGSGFAVRMYIPELRKNVIKFPIDQWERAIWIPTKGYAKVTPQQLERKWREFINNAKKSASQRIASSDSHL